MLYENSYDEKIIGKLTFYSQTQHEIIRMIKSIELTFPTGEHQIIFLLRRNPADRLPLKDVLQHAWILKNEDITAIQDNYVKRKKTLN
ncbi:unnamed protein product [Rotaria sordida]|uniref:Aurora kinase n=1 Tax=Rotaria sordida TaxID=392033 RepID=A0A819TDI5_9BILA|nr:unnamed protein product [Rotaria sordida]CAF1498230.1 unnamed protein product [Rotaria sordida]CAF4079367.1 unnamed protein product [Rotaria sordida]CAF4079887.1 unnamed protein product [Rotaria sordida]